MGSQTIHLQIICKRIENIAKNLQSSNNQPVIITTSNLPEFKEVFLSFYNKSVEKAVNSVQQDDMLATTIRKFIEDQLIRNKYRISLDEIICLDYITKETIEALTDTGLLRSEPNSKGRLNYELSHDTFIEPILSSRNVRKIKEEGEEKIRIEKEKNKKIKKVLKEELEERDRKAKEEKIERERKTQKKIIIILSIAAIVSILFAIFGIVNWQKADRNAIVAQKARNNADSMRIKMEIAIFDKAIKEQNTEWRGYYNYGKYNKPLKEDLEEIDTLDLSSYALSYLPKEIIECTNLSSINLLKNPNLDWQDCFEKLAKLTNLTEIKISVYDLDSIPKQYWNKITGIEILDTNLTEIPKNILQQKQLTYLNLSNSKLTSLPIEIGNLTNLTELSLWKNQLTSLPMEIGNLTNLTELSLWKNQLTSLPMEIGKLTNLKGLYLQKNQLTNLPNGIINLINLEYFNLTENKFSEDYKKEFEKQFPNCIIYW